MSRHAARPMQLRPPTVRPPAMTAAEAARRLGMTVDEFFALAHAVLLEPTYSIEEVAQHFGCKVWAVNQLVRLGRIHGAKLHPTRGGLWPTFKPLHKSRRIPLSAIERHKAHMNSEVAA